MTSEDIEDQKRVEYYAASVSAWYNTSLEHDKGIFTLSAGGIGLLLTLLTTVGLYSAEALILYIGAILSFVISLLAVLIVFKCNQTHIQEILSGKSISNDPVLNKLDSIAIYAFGIGAIFTAIISISTAVHSYTTNEKTMTNEDIKKTSVPLRVSLGSFNGAFNLQQPADLIKSFNGAVNLQPPPTTSTSTTPIANSSVPVLPVASQTQNSNGK